MVKKKRKTKLFPVHEEMSLGWIEDAIDADTQRSNGVMPEHPDRGARLSHVAQLRTGHPLELAEAVRSQPMGVGAMLTASFALGRLAYAQQKAGALQMSDQVTQSRQRGAQRTQALGEQFWDQLTGLAQQLWRERTDLFPFKTKADFYSAFCSKFRLQLRKQFPNRPTLDDDKPFIKSLGRFPHELEKRGIYLGPPLSSS